MSEWVSATSGVEYTFSSRTRILRVNIVVRRYKKNHVFVKELTSVKKFDTYIKSSNSLNGIVRHGKRQLLYFFQRNPNLRTRSKRLKECENKVDPAGKLIEASAGRGRMSNLWHKPRPGTERFRRSPTESPLGPVLTHRLRRLYFYRGQIQCWSVFGLERGSGFCSAIFMCEVSCVRVFYKHCLSSLAYWLPL